MIVVAPPMFDPSREPQYDAETEKALLGHLSGSDPEQRRGAAYCLGDVIAPTTQTLEALLGAAASDDEVVAKSAIASVAQIAARLAPPPTERMLAATRAPESRVRAAAIHGLGNLVGLSEEERARCVERLLELVEDPPVRSVACENLGYFGRAARQGATRMAALLGEDVDAGSRIAAMQTIGNLYLNEGGAPAEVVAAVRRQLEHPDEKVRGMARWCVQALERKPEPSTPAAPSREELLARADALQQKARDLQDRLGEIGRTRLTPGQLAFRRLLLLLLLAGLIGLPVLGWFLAGGWGIAGGIALPIAGVLGWAVVANFLAGGWVSAGKLLIAPDPQARTVRFKTTFADDRLPFALLAVVDRELLRSDVGGRLTPGMAAVMAELRAMATARTQGAPLPETAWQATPGDATSELLEIGRNRLGASYSFGSTIGGPKKSVEDERAICTALVRHGLERPDGTRLAQALSGYCDDVERSGRGKGKALRRAARRLER